MFIAAASGVWIAGTPSTAPARCTAASPNGRRRYCAWSRSPTAKATDNLWGERWSKLVTNSMANGVSACTGLSGAAMAQDERIRRFQARLGGEAIRIGEALGYKLEEINHLPPEIIARAGEGDAAALARYDDRVLTQPRGSADQR